MIIDHNKIMIDFKQFKIENKNYENEPNDDDENEPKHFTFDRNALSGRDSKHIKISNDALTAEQISGYHKCCCCHDCCYVCYDDCYTNII